MSARFRSPAESATSHGALAASICKQWQFQTPNLLSKWRGVSIATIAQDEAAIFRPQGTRRRPLVKAQMGKEEADPLDAPLQSLSRSGETEADSRDVRV